MWTWVKKLLAVQRFVDEEQALVAGLLNASLLIFIATGLVLNIALLLVDPGGSSVLSILLWLSFVVLWVVARRGSYRMVRLCGTLLCLAIWTLVTLNGWHNGGLRNLASTSYFALVVVAGLLLGEIGVIGFGVLSLVSSLALYFGEVEGLITSTGRSVRFEDWVKFSLILITVIQIGRAHV